jgi:hypothetical protein
MNPRSKTVWQQWIEKVEAVWPVAASQIASICDCDERTATRIRDWIADSRGEEPLRLKGGVKKVEIDAAIVEHIAENWPMSADAIGKKFGLGSALSRRHRDAAISRHNLGTDIGRIKAAKHNEMQFAKLDAIRAEKGDDNLSRHDLRVIAGCGWSTISKWKQSRSIPMKSQKKVKAPPKRSMASVYEIRKAKEQAAAPIVKPKPQPYATGRWFRNKRSGEVVSALFCVSGGDVKFFEVTT